MDFSLSHSIAVVEDRPEISNYVCEITQKLLHETSDSTDVVLWNFKSQLPTTTINAITMCILEDNPMLITDLSVQMAEVKVLKTKIFIILSDDVNQVRI